MECLETFVLYFNDQFFENFYLRKMLRWSFIYWKFPISFSVKIIILNYELKFWRRSKVRLNMDNKIIPSRLIAFQKFNEKPFISDGKLSKLLVDILYKDKSNGMTNLRCKTAKIFSLDCQKGWQNHCRKVWSISWLGNMRKLINKFRASLFSYVLLAINAKRRCGRYVDEDELFPGPEDFYRP